MLQIYSYITRRYTSLYWSFTHRITYNLLIYLHYLKHSCYKTSFKLFKVRWVKNQDLEVLHGNHRQTITIYPTVYSLPMEHRLWQNSQYRVDKMHEFWVSLLYTLQELPLLTSQKISWWLNLTVTILFYSSGSLCGVWHCKPPTPTQYAPLYWS